MNADVHVESAHPSVHDLAAYLDRIPPGSTRERIEGHLVLCDRCLSDLIATGRLLRWYDAGGRGIEGG